MGILHIPATFGGLADLSDETTFDSASSPKKTGVRKSINGAPFIVLQPESVTVQLRQAATFSVTVAGTVPMKFQWLRNGIGIPNGTNATLTLSNVQLSDAGQYSVVVFNRDGVVRSKEVMLNVNDAVSPGIVRQPENQTISAGGNALFLVEANGQQPLVFQWFRNGVKLTNRVDAFLVLSNVTASDSGNYTVSITNSLGTVTSNPASLVVNEGPRITRGPIGQVVVPQANISFSVEASGSSPLQYQWYKHMNPIAGATNKELSLKAVKLDDAGTYFVIVKNAFGSEQSSSALLDVKVPVIFLSQPTNQTVLVGQEVRFEVEVAGDGPFTFQWFRDSLAVVGGTSRTLLLSNVKVTDSGQYSVAVSSPIGTAYSALAQLKVDVPATILAQPLSQHVFKGGNTVLFVNAAGTEPMLYQWYKDDSVILGSTKKLLELTNVTAETVGRYKVKVSNQYRSVESDEAVVSLAHSIQISQQPKSQTVLAGDSVVFSIEAESANLLTYQWFKNDFLILGAVDPMLILQSVKGSDSGIYRVAVSDIFETVSVEAILTVDTPVEIQKQPEGRSLKAGEDLLLEVLAVGRKPLQYQWLYGGTAIPGAQSHQLLLKEVKYSDRGDYQVRITDGQYTVFSEKAFINVNSAVTISVHPQSRDVFPGSNVRFFVEAEGTIALSYQWLKDGQPIPTATANELFLEQVMGRDAASYSVIASNRFGTASSLEAQLRVRTPPAVKGDLNRDGTSDLLFQSSDGFLGIWIMNDGDLRHVEYLYPSHIGDANWNVITFADFDGDDFDDLLLQNRNGSIGIWRMEGANQVGSETLAGAGETWRVVGAADFNRDEHQDLLFQHLDGTLAVWGMSKTQVISSALLKPSHPGSAGWKAVGTGDFNKDGWPDLIFQHADGTLATWFLRETDVTGVAFLEPNEPGNSEWRVVSVADRNGDGQSDLLFQHLDGTLGLWLMNGVRMDSSRLVQPSHPGLGWRVVAP